MNVHQIPTICLSLLICSVCTCNGDTSPSEAKTPRLLPELSSSSKNSQTPQPPAESGVSSCPCLAFDDGFVRPIEEHTNESLDALGSSINLTTYGFGCGLHDETSLTCRGGCGPDQFLTPTPIACDRSWCKRNWCWIDPSDCNVLNKRSTLFGEYDRYYSYATCGDMDSFTQNHRLGSLRGRTLRVAFNSNTGGWQGAYSSAGKSFEGPTSRWSGPAVDFVIETARVGHFWIQLAEPPESLRNFSNLFSGPSLFDYCVYSTALGFLDMCVAQYTVTDERASVTDWLLLGSQELRVIIDKVHGNEVSNWQHFRESFSTLFLPFTESTWGFVVLFVVPVLGCLTVVHEYGKTGSAYRRNEVVVEFDADGQRLELKEHRQPMIQHLMRSVYITALSIVHQDYAQPVVTAGAMLNLLGISFFILTIIAVYTANLASILAQEKSFVGLSGLEEAINRGYRICAERKQMEVVQSLYRNLTTEEGLFVVDPVDLGGDGLPGFTCCGPRLRVFEMLDPVRAQSDNRFCHVAIAPVEDLEVEQGAGEYCHLRAVGHIVGQSQVGMPVYHGVSTEVTSLFLTMKHDGILEKALIVARPQSNCPVPEGGEGTALTIEQLSGLWVVTFGFAAVGLIVTFVAPCLKSNRKVEKHAIVKFDQKGNPVNMMEHNDVVWLQELRIQRRSASFDSENGASGEIAREEPKATKEPLTPILEDSSDSFAKVPDTGTLRRAARSIYVGSMQ